MKFSHVIITVLFALPAFSQDVTQIVQTGNAYFESQQYIKAIKYYKEALEQEEGSHTFAMFQLGECYRNILDYSSAEYYYEEVKKQGDSRYPLAGFYLAYTQKLTGKYENALAEFEEFIDYIKPLTTENQKYKTFYEQAKNEREGCILALAQMTTPKPDFNTKPLPAPVNTPNNDYAPYFFDDDNSIVVSSADKASSEIDNTFGEAFADMYRYRKSSGGWDEAKLKDKLEKVVNTKNGDGTGVFNRSRDKFYYTYCNDEGECAIFLTRKKQNEWEAPIKLKSTINQKGTNSKHPMLSPAGDTIYFVSDRKGGIGGLDIWFSISSNGENWSQPQNLGDQINTPFDEISPFYSENEKALFFASNGHRGFGGYDIYMAKGDNFNKAEIFNIGIPFNSNKDDAFFILGTKSGYLSSNREGGAGKFDIYAFDITSEKDIIAEIGVETSIAGRQSMFSDDLEFETEDIKKVNEILSRLLASKLEGVELVFSNTQLDFYNSLSTEDREKIERIVDSRFRKISESELKDLHIRDEYYYVSLTEEEKRHVDRMVMSYVEEEDLSKSVHLNREDRQFYEILSEKDKEKIDQIIASRIKTARDFKFKSTAYDEFEGKDKINIDQIAFQYLKEKKNLEDLTLNMTNNAFMQQLDDERKDLAKQSIKDKMLMMSDDDNLKLSVEDRLYYQNLKDEDLEKIKNIAHSFLLSDVDHINDFVSKEDMDFYRNQSAKDKGHIDKVIAKMIKNTALSDLLYAESNFEKDQIGLLEESVSGATNLTEMLEVANKNSDLRNLDPTDKSRMMRFLSSAAPAWMEREETVFLQDESEVKREYSEMVARRGSEEIDDGPFTLTTISDGSSEVTAGLEVRPVSSGEVVNELSAAALSFYNGLSADNQLKVDRFIAARYINEDYQDGSLIEQDLTFEKSINGDAKVYTKLLSRKLKGEFLTSAEESTLKDAFVFYSSKARNEKPRWNRVVIAEALDINPAGNYYAQKKDYRFYQSLTDSDQSLVREIESFRFQNHRVLSENMASDSKDVVVPGLTRNLPKYVVETEYMSIEGTLIDNNKGTSVNAFPVALENKDGRKVYQTETNNKGEFSFQSIQTDEYKLVSGSDEYAKDFAESYFVKDLEVKEVDEKASVVQTTTSVFFDLSSYQLRREAQATLDEIIEEYKKAPFSIELEAHTDNSGSAALNQRLSKDRGEFAAKYLKSKGVAEKDIIIRFFGMNKPIASNDNVYGRQFNRRLDINMRSIGKIDFKPRLVYIAKPKATVKNLASLYGISESELKSTNGISSGALEDNQPVRLPDNGVSPDLSLLVPMNSNVTRYSNYVVKPGETVTSIAEKLRIPEELIMELNDLKSVNVPAGRTILVLYIKRPG